mgnify:CR=1 FL=1
MILNRLSILNFKNIAQTDLELSSGINCFLGNNGMGKTNLLDAVYYLSFCKSSTNVIDSQNIKHEENFFMLQGYYDRDGVPEELYCGLKRKQKKQFKRNKKEYSRLSDHIGFVPLVLVSPADSELIRGGSDERRKFLDLVISQFDKDYLNTLIRYNKALAQRNALLKDEVTEASLYEIWEEQMSLYGSSIYNSRKAFLQEFTPVFQEFYDYISIGSEEVKLEYTSDIVQGDLSKQLASVRDRDRILGYTTRGIHRDDLEMKLGEYPMKRIGSQGQNKTFLVALKLAQFHFLNKNGTTPILLLDDIFDKLDAHRVESIIKLVPGERFGQIFITDTNRKYLDEIIKQTGNSYHLYNVDNGNITRSKEDAL